MQYFVYAQSEDYPIALLIKNTAFNKQELGFTYTNALIARGIDKNQLLFVALPYNQQGKAPAAFIKENLETILSGLVGVNTKYLYCADANYFKVLTGSAKAEPHLGYCLPCKVKGYEHMQVVLGVNHKSLLYTPANEPKLTLSIDTFAAVLNNNYQSLGADIIHRAHYPSDLESIRLALQELHQYPVLSADIETGSLDFEKAGIGTITFAWSKHEGIAFACDYVPFPADMSPADRLHRVGQPLPDYPDITKLKEGQDANEIYQTKLAKAAESWHGYLKPNPEVRRLIKQFLETYEGTLRWHNAPYDLKVLIFELWMENLLDTNGALKGLDLLTERFEDTKIISYLATNSTAGNRLSLKDQAHEFAGNWAKEDIKDIRRIPLPDLLQYNLVDGLATNYVWEKNYPIMVHDLQEELYLDLMKPSLKTIIQIELTGMPLNPAAVQNARKVLEGIVAQQQEILSRCSTVRQFTTRLQRVAMEAANAKLKTKQHPIEKFADVTFNPNSTLQKQKLLFEEFGLPVLDYTETKQPATGGDTLEKLIHHTDDPECTEILQALIEIAKAGKVLSSFIPAFEAAIDKGDGVVYLHGSFNLGGTVSGRLSSSDPNLQNIPAGSTYGKLIKSCFQAPFGWLFGGADFNSLEDYISALTTKDPNKLKVYLEGYDGHCLRAFSYFPDRLPGIVDTVESINSMKKLFPEVRQDSKAPTFALTYQGTYHTLMNNLGFPEDMAKQIEANYHELYKVSDEWVQAKLDEARQTGYVTVAFGLRLRTPLLAKTIGGFKRTPYEAAAEGRTAGNALGQSYGLLTNRAVNAFMKKVWASPFRFDILPVALIHDAIYLLIRDRQEVVEWVNRELIAAMQWQELPEIQHDKVKLGAELSIFWPTWANELTIPNGATGPEIRQLCFEHIQKLNQPKEAA